MTKPSTNASNLITFIIILLFENYSASVDSAVDIRQIAIRQNIAPSGTVLHQFIGIGKCQLDQHDAGNDPPHAFGARPFAELGDVIWTGIAAVDEERYGMI